MTIEFTGDDVSSTRDVSGVTGDSIGQNTGTIKHGYNFGSVTKGIAAYYPFDDDASDQSGLGNDGTVNGATFISDGGPFGTGAYSFDGVDDYIEIPDLEKPSDNGDGDWSISFFVSYADLGSTGQDFYRWQDTGGSRIYHRDGQIHYNHSGISQTPIAASPGVYDEFTHYFFVFDNNGSTNDYTIKFYADAVFQGSVSSPTPGTETGFRWGHRYGSSNGYALDGSIDDGRIYDRALSAPEIEALYNISSPSIITPEDTLQ